MVGYPVNREELDNLIHNMPLILNSAAERVNNENPDIKPFQFSKKTGTYIKKERPIRDWVAKRYSISEWVQTKGRKYSLSHDAFKEHFSSRDENFGGSMVRYLATKQSMNGFSPTAKNGTFLDKLGSDSRSRPWGGTYGSQTGRSQPSSTHFLPLKAKWFRYLIQPKPGRAIVGLDYQSQEFLIAACLSKDKKMVNAYISGDVYLAFGKDAGLIPKDATKTTHSKERDSFKDVVLGTSYDMGAKGLAKRMSAKGDKEWSEAEAEALIDTFYATYSGYDEFKRNVNDRYYATDHMLRLSDGWTLFGGNENYRSVCNFPTQGEASVILRRAVALAQDAGLDVIYTLHDAIYIEYKSNDPLPPRMLANAMSQAFVESFPQARSEASAIRLDGHAWSYDYKTKPDWKYPFPITFSERYIDERGKKDLEHYKQFLQQKFLSQT
jgi:hypothetical protein